MDGTSVMGYGLLMGKPVDAWQQTLCSITPPEGRGVIRAVNVLQARPNEDIGYIAVTHRSQAEFGSKMAVSHAIRLVEA